MAVVGSDLIVGDFATAVDGLFTSSAGGDRGDKTSPCAEVRTSETRPLVVSIRGGIRVFGWGELVLGRREGRARGRGISRAFELGILLGI